METKNVRQVVDVEAEYVRLEPGNGTRYELHIVHLPPSWLMAQGLRTDTKLVAVVNFHGAAYMHRSADAAYVAEKLPSLGPGDVKALTAYFNEAL
jgi:hypothetical protein